MCNSDWLVNHLNRPMQQTIKYHKMVTDTRTESSLVKTPICFFISFCTRAIVSYRLKFPSYCLRVYKHIAAVKVTVLQLLTSMLELDVSYLSQ